MHFIQEVCIKKAFHIKIEGLVQGVGFRPFIYRIAHEHGIAGWVENRNDGVFIHAEATQEKIEAFLGDIGKKAPQASSIFSISHAETALENHEKFIITRSRNTSGEVTEVSPDIATCGLCLEDLSRQSHRIDYPFINCTNCGPRFTIIRDLPYDRDKTTMQPFIMCPVCKTEYEDVLDRRFHAQPVACNNCGPVYSLIMNGKVTNDIHGILDSAALMLKQGKILAIKGMGGFHLACDAQNEEAVRRLRSRKYREGKPFAVMFRDVAAAKRYVITNETEEELLASWKRPIVILENRGDHMLAPSVSNGFNTTGTMLPYMPFHYQLFERIETNAIVLTSGNISDEPVIIDNNEALKRLKGVADVFITYNRDIHNRADDSVAFTVNHKPRLIRRSRGFVPSPVRTGLDVEGIFAAGAELVNCFAIGKGNQAILSQHIGDLQNLETFDFYTESAERFMKLFRAGINLVAHDLHPDYLSTRYAHDLAHTSGIKPEPVQHHHAHIASCMAENLLDEKVIGIALDGTGLGDDNTIWGGEALICDLVSYRRYSHLEPVLLPGGDAATKNPWRTAFSYLFRTYGADFRELDLPFMKRLPDKEAELIATALKNKINTPETTSMGRFFDAVSALTGICTTSLFHAEAPMRLEKIIKKGTKGSYPFEIDPVIKTDSTIEALVNDIRKQTDPGVISAKFHNTVIDIIFAMAKEGRKVSGISKVALSGGSFQNRYLLEGTEKKLEEAGFKVYSQERIPSNDGGIALGQMAVAAKRRSINN